MTPTVVFPSTTLGPTSDTATSPDPIAAIMQTFDPAPILNTLSSDTR